MLYAKVVLSLPVEGPFDYRVPSELEKKICLGMRVLVDFRNKKEVAYVTGLSGKTGVKRIKDILSLIDLEPVLDKPVLLLAQRISQYYCCSLGEAIACSLPQDLRKGKKLK